MIIKIKSGKKMIDVGVSFDVFGNLYFDAHGKSYQTNVNGKNNLSLDEGDFKIFGVKEGELSKFKLIEDHNMLKEKTKKELQKYRYDIYDQEYDAEFVQDQIEIDYKYFPEKKEFFDFKIIDSKEYIDEDSINTFGEDNLKFNFSHLSIASPIPIFYRKYGEVSSLYDSYIYSDNKMIYRSFSKNENSIFTIKIHNNGELSLRPTGNRETHYQMSLTNDNKLVLNKKI